MRFYCLPQHWRSCSKRQREVKHDVDRFAEKPAQPYRRTTLTLREVLQHPDGSDTFLRFCQTQYASENLLFWLNAQKFYILMNMKKASKLNVKLNQETVVSQARRLYERFLKPDAAQWVCVDMEAVRSIENKLENQPGEIDHKLFLGPQEETLNTLEQDIMPRFVKTVIVNQTFEANADLVYCLEKKLLLPPSEIPSRIRATSSESPEVSKCVNDPQTSIPFGLNCSEPMHPVDASSTGPHIIVS
mmetsp:Transcript_2133/g.2445  ORF Transcript_2133/g.2445 Transcript_2133/m.2445 type:complete len:245 (+) Transcript_2133:354-1088(+)